MNETSVKAAFQEWWLDSYKRPPSQLGAETHVAFAMHILKLMELTKEEAG
jgi:hypothetical protein